MPEFSTLNLSASLCAVASELGYSSPTEVQAQTIPLILNGKDVTAKSSTGSGKTAAFVLPILDRLDLGVCQPQALVLCPTRELCAQVTREFRKLGRRQPGLFVLSLSGGEPKREQSRALSRGAQLLVGTPGRVLDHLQGQGLDLSALRSVVLDEADRMLDMGFSKDVESILAGTPGGRQTLLFSATFPPAVSELSKKHQRAAVKVSVETPNEAPLEIRQLAVPVHPTAKFETLCRVLSHFAYESALIFCNLKVTVSDLAASLSAAGASVECIHGDLEQRERDLVLARFRNSSIRLLVASDVAARGLDVTGLDLVVNFDLPTDPTTYFHRIGRTGRAGNAGLAVALFTPGDKARRSALEQFSGEAPEELDPARLNQVGKALKYPARMTTLRVSGGRKDKLRPGDILGALTGESGGLSAENVGRIETHDRFSYVAVSRELSSEACGALNRGRIKGRRFKVNTI